MDVASWLRQLGLERYEPAFRENDISAAVLPSLTADDLKELGVTSVGHRRRLLDAIVYLRTEARAVGDPKSDTHEDEVIASHSAAAGAERRQLRSCGRI
jgi:hypothetical protein